MEIKISFAGLLFLVFLVLRLTDRIDWAWYWVAMPLIWPIVVILVALAGTAGVIAIGGIGIGAADLCRRIARPFRKLSFKRKLKIPKDM